MGAGLLAFKRQIKFDIQKTEQSTQELYIAREPSSKLVNSERKMEQVDYLPAELQLRHN